MFSLSRASLVALILVASTTTGCAALRSVALNAARPKATAKSDRDVAACEKMCEVAGDAESNKAAVDRCKKDCRE
jgi:hypothetical protein